MIRRALLLAVLVCTVAAPWAAKAADIELLFDPDLTAYMHNTTAADISFDGYQIALDDDKVGKLDPAGWDSLSDRMPLRINELIVDVGPAAVGFGELNPTTVQIAEGNLIGAGVLKAGAKFSLGKPFGEGGYWVDFFFKRASNTTQDDGGRYFIPRVPEPSTFILAALAGLGLAAVRVRSKR